MFLEKKNNLGIASPNKRKGHRGVGKALEGKLTIYYRYLFPRLDYMHINVAGGGCAPQFRPNSQTAICKIALFRTKRVTILSVFIIILLMQFYISAFMLRVSFQYQIPLQLSVVNRINWVSYIKVDSNRSKMPKKKILRVHYTDIFKCTLD